MRDDYGGQRLIEVERVSGGRKIEEIPLDVRLVPNDTTSDLSERPNGSIPTLEVDGVSPKPKAKGKVKLAKVDGQRKSLFFSYGLLTVALGTYTGAWFTALFWGGQETWNRVMEVTPGFVSIILGLIALCMINSFSKRKGPLGGI